MKNNKQTTIYIQVETKKFPLIITDKHRVLDGTELVHVFCEGARLDQDYPKGDLPSLLEDMEELILMEQKNRK